MLSAAIRSCASSARRLHVLDYEQQHDSESPMNNIVVPVDGSEHAKRAAKFAAKLAGDANAALTLIHVYDPPTASLMGLAAKSREEIDAITNADAKSIFDAVLEAIGPTEVPISTHAVMGHPAPEIIRFAQALDADLLVMGSRGLSELRGLLLGSVSEQVLRRATCAVTIVR
jgi:nucleotide-binding universal stress UspA family protein